MSEPADSAGEPGEATGAADAVADSTPDPSATGQEQGDQSRINGLQSVLGRRTSERDEALREIDTLKAQLAQYETDAVAGEEPDPSQIELMYPERFQSEPEGDEVDPLAPPEPPVIEPIVMGVSPSRSQSAPLGDAPLIGNTSSPSARYQQDQADIAAMKRQLDVAGARWVDQARQSGLMND